MIALSTQTLEIFVLNKYCTRYDNIQSVYLRQASLLLPPLTVVTIRIFQTLHMRILS